MVNAAVVPRSHLRQVNTEASVDPRAALRRESTTRVSTTQHNIASQGRIPRSVGVGFRGIRRAAGVCKTWQMKTPVLIEAQVAIGRRQSAHCLRTRARTVSRSTRQ